MAEDKRNYGKYEGRKRFKRKYERAREDYSQNDNEMVSFGSDIPFKVERVPLNEKNMRHKRKI